MRKLIGCVLASTLAAGTACAGLYIPGEPADFVPSNGKVAALPFDQFRLKLGDVIGAGLPEDRRSALGKAYAAKAAQLLSRRDRLTPIEMISLGGYLYRLNNPEGAFSIWHDASRRDPRNFEALSNLSLFFQSQGDLVQARRYQVDARSLQPKVLTGMDPGQSAWCLRVEGTMRDLLRGRVKEAQQAVPPNQLTPDDLFGVQFVAEDGSYQPSQLAAAQKAKLPDDATAVVQQMLLWLPGDSRLYWLLAELFNAQGNADAALAIMNECSDVRRFQPDLLRDHRRILQEGQERNAAEQERLRAEQQAAEEQKDFKNHPEILWAVAGAGGLALLALVSWQVRLVARKARRSRN